MPELPEVETIVRGLKRSIQDHEINSIHLSKFSLRTAFPAEMESAIQGMKITGIYRRAKYILINLDGMITIIIHLGMSGNLSVGADLPPRKHDHATFALTTPDGDATYMVYNDPRRFGLVTAAFTADLNDHPLLCKLGIEPLTEDFTSHALMEACKKRSTPIKSTIMNNDVLVGVGNIYASESLFSARINPLRTANSLNIEEYTLLTYYIKEVLIAAINSGGSTLKDYSQLSGESGYFQHHFKVYGRKGQPCCVCDHTIESFNISGRSTFHCPLCQP